MIKRSLILPKKESFFLFGPRQTGKSTLINGWLEGENWKINLLLTDHFSKYSKYPDLFRKEALQKIEQEGVHVIFIDEVQKVPDLLNEVQFIMDTKGTQFIMTGSSARKLRRKGVNLLGGRSLQQFLFPFTYEEIKSVFSLESILRFGSLPSIYEKEENIKIDILRAYVDLYLREEIKAEGIVRNLGGFSRFLDMAASQSGEIVNFSSIARDASLSPRTVQSYYEILEDTLIGFPLEAWRSSPRRRLVLHPKFYFFDLGVVNAINGRLFSAPDNVLRGKLFEQFIIIETCRLLRYHKSEARIFYWQTNVGTEVDLLIEKGGKLCHAFEIKAKKIIGGTDISGLRSFNSEYPHVSRHLICEAEQPYRENGIDIIPWKNYLDKIKEFIL